MCVRVLRKGFNIGLSSSVTPLPPPGTDCNTSQTGQGASDGCLWCGRQGQECFAPLCLGNWSIMKDPWKAVMPKASGVMHGIAEMIDGVANIYERKPVQTACSPISKTKSVFLPKHGLLFL